MRLVRGQPDPWVRSARLFVAVGLLTLTACPPSSSGPVSGQSAPEPEVSGVVLDAKGQPVAEAVVSIGSGLAPRAYAPPATHPELDQKGKTFLPHVLPVLVGTTVDVTNEDTVSHNVYSRSEVKPFDLGIYRSPESRPVLFDKPGRVDLGCSIHVSMHAIVLVLENPYFATTDAQGKFALRGVPAGTYSVRVWHELYPEVSTGGVVVSPGKTASLRLELGAP